MVHIRRHYGTGGRTKAVQPPKILQLFFLLSFAPAALGTELDFVNQFGKEVSEHHRTNTLHSFTFTNRDGTVLSNATLVKVEGEMATIMAGTVGLKVEPHLLPIEIQHEVAWRQAMNFRADRWKETNQLRQLATMATNISAEMRQVRDQIAVMVEPFPITVTMRVTETNAVFWRFGWKASIANLHRTAILKDNLRIQFLDRDGFEISQAVIYGVLLVTGERREMSGSELIHIPAATKVTQVRARWGD